MKIGDVYGAPTDTATWRRITRVHPDGAHTYVAFTLWGPTDWREFVKLPGVVKIDVNSLVEANAVRLVHSEGDGR